MSKTEVASTPPHSLTFDGLPYPGQGGTPIFFFMKITAKGVKEITHMPLVTFFSVLERPGENRRGSCNPPWLDEG